MRLSLYQLIETAPYPHAKVLGRPNRFFSRASAERSPCGHASVIGYNIAEQRQCRTGRPTVPNLYAAIDTRKAKA